MRRLPAILVLLGLVSACAWTSTTSPPARSPGASSSLAAGSIVSATPASYRSVLVSLRGRPIVVNFWASWCVPCVSEMPRLVDAAHRYGGRVAFLGVDVQDAGGPARTFARRYGIPFGSLADPDRKIAQAQKVVGIPTTQFYAGDGTLAFRTAGEIKADQLERKIQELLRLERTSVAPSGG